MAEYICVLVVTALIIGFLCGRWRVKEYSGDVIVSKESGSCTFALDIPAEDIPNYQELVFRVVKKEDSHNG